jgi:NTE family protein
VKKQVSLVLSGGGARGIAHIGVIEELEKQGFIIKSIAGTSMGAVVGGIYAAGKLQEFKNWLYTLDKLEVFKLVDFTLSSQGLIKGDRVFKKMKEFIPDMNIEELKIHYTATATDIINKEEVVFTKGSIYEAIRASTAIPSVITPVKKDNALLVDGGVMNNVPINHVKRSGGDILIVVYVNAQIPVDKPSISKKEKEKKQSIYQKKIKQFQDQLHSIHPKSEHEKFGYFDLINQSISLLTDHISRLSIEKNPPDILIEVSHDVCGTYDFYKAEELVEIGRYAAVKSINEYFNK